MSDQKSRERRRMKRQMLSRHLPIKDKKTLQMIGHLVDISPIGFGIDSKIPIQTGSNYDLRLDLPEKINEKVSLELTAKAIWCQQEPFQQFVFNAGSEITGIVSEERKLLKHIIKRYGTS